MFAWFKQRGSLIWSSIFLVLGGFVCFIIYLYEADEGLRPPPFELTPVEADYFMGVAAGLTALGLVALLIVRRVWSSGPPKWVSVTLKSAAVLVLVFGALSYFVAERSVAQRHYPKFHDLYHYFFGLKYYPEVGYNQLYNCHLKADGERQRPQIDDRERVRDLKTYRIRRAEELRSKAQCDTFSSERWQEFREDSEFFRRLAPRGVIRDHGYNGTPFHARIAGLIANIPEVTYANIVALTFVDIGGLCLMFAVAVWAFGWKAAFLFALFFFSNFADRFYYIGASFFRYQWLVTLGIGLACLKKDKLRLAALLLTASAMLNVFPLFFLAGIGIKVLYQLLRTRKLESRYRTFVAWCVIGASLWGGVSLLHDRPLDRYQTFFSNMSMHSDLLTRSRIGFKYNFMFRGEYTSEAPNYSYARKRAEFERWPTQVAFFTLLAIVLAWTTMLIFRLDDFRATVLAGFTLFFMLLGTVEYYYAVAAVLVLLWVDELHRRRGVLMLLLLFVLQAATFVVWWQSQYLRFMNNHVMTWYFTAYLLVVLVVLSFTSGLITPEGWLFRRVITPIRGWLGRRFGATARGGRRRLATFSLGVALLVAAVVIELTTDERGVIVEERGEGPWLTLAATGDSILARRQHHYFYEHGPRWSIRQVRDQLRRADIATTNLETVIAARGDIWPRGASNMYSFRGRPVMIDLLTEGGFDYVSSGNNHAMDYGPEALAHQRELLKMARIAHSGAGRDVKQASSPAYVKAGDVTVAFISTYVGGFKMGATASEPGLFQVENHLQLVDALREPYEEARRHAHLVVFTPHWGANWTDGPGLLRVAVAHDIIDLGFDAIIGHSAHQIHGMELYKGRPILYDVGNFVADFTGELRSRYGGIFTLDFNELGFSAVRYTPLWLSNGRARLAKTRRGREARELFQSLTYELDDRIELRRDGESLVTTFRPPTKRRAEPTPPADFIVAGSTKRLPRAIREQRDWVEVDEPPAYAEGFEPIKMAVGVDIIGVKAVEAAYPGACFMVEVALRVREKMTGRWDGVIAAKAPGRDEPSITYYHPISNGGTDPELWEVGQVVLDRTCVRNRGGVPSGRHDLYWAWRDRLNDRIVHTMPASGEEEGPPAKIGSILFTRSVNRLAAGVDWDGMLDEAGQNGERRDGPTRAEDQ